LYTAQYLQFTINSGENLEIQYIFTNITRDQSNGENNKRQQPYCRCQQPGFNGRNKINYTVSQKVTYK